MFLIGASSPGRDLARCTMIAMTATQQVHSNFVRFSFLFFRQSVGGVRPSLGIPAGRGRAVAHFFTESFANNGLAWL